MSENNHRLFSQLGRFREETNRGFTAISEKIDQIPARTDPHASQLWGNFQTAKNLLIGFKVSAAQAILEELQDRSWESCPAELKSRILGLLARTKELQGDIAEAVTLRLRASDIAPTEREKLLQLAFAYALQDYSEKVFPLAQKLVENCPNTADGWNLWIQFAPEIMNLASIESQVPATVLDDADVLSGLSLRALAEADHVKAQGYARQALKAAPDSPLAHCFLALRLLQQHEGHLPDVILSQDLRQSIEEAEKLLEEALKKVGSDAPPHILALFRSNRALALRMLGHPDRAIEELATAYKLTPDEPHVVLEYARLLVHQNRFNYAIQVLNRYLETHDSDIGAALLIEAYLDLDPPNYTEAVAAAKRALGKNPNGVFSQMVLLHQCISAARRLADMELAETFLKESDKLSLLVRFAIRAEHSRLWGALQESQSFMRQVLDNLSSETDPNLRRYVAHLLDRGGLHIEALDIWRGIVPTDLVTQDTFSFLACAKKCGSISDILVLCRTLRETGIRDLRLYDIEVNVLNQLCNLSDAITLTQLYLDSVAEALKIEFRRKKACQIDE